MSAKAGEMSPASLDSLRKDTFAHRAKVSSWLPRQMMHSFARSVVLLQPCQGFCNVFFLVKHSRRIGKVEKQSRPWRMSFIKLVEWCCSRQCACLRRGSIPDNPCCEVVSALPGTPPSLRGRVHGVSLFILFPSFSHTHTHTHTRARAHTENGQHSDEATKQTSKRRVQETIKRCTNAC